MLPFLLLHGSMEPDPLFPQHTFLILHSQNHAEQGQIESNLFPSVKSLSCSLCKGKYQSTPHYQLTLINMQYRGLTYRLLWVFCSSQQAGKIKCPAAEILESFALEEEEDEHATSWAYLPRKEKYVVLVGGAARSGRPYAGFGSLKKASIWFSSVSKLKFLKWSQIFK